MDDIEDQGPLDVLGSAEALSAARKEIADMSWRANAEGGHLHEQWDAYLDQAVRQARGGR